MIRKGENEMKQYITPDMLILIMESSDVIATSGIAAEQGKVLDPEEIKDSADF